MQTSTAISRSAAAALTDGGTAKDRHVLPAAATKRFDAILHVIEIVLRDMANADPATRVALARLTEALARIVDFPPQPQESLRDFTRRLAAHMDVLPPAARALLEKQLNQQPLLAALKMLVETLRPALTLDLRIDLPLTRDGLWHPDAVSALFPDEDERPAFRQPTIQAPLPTRMAFSQAPGVAPGAPHLQQALGQAFSPETTARAPAATGYPPQTADEPLPPLREAAAFLASDAHALAQAVAIARGHAADVPIGLVADRPPADLDPTAAGMVQPDIETAAAGTPPETGTNEPADAHLASVARPDRPITSLAEPHSASPKLAAAEGLQPAEDEQTLRSGPMASKPSETISKGELPVLARPTDTVARQMPTGAEAASALLQPEEDATGQPVAPPSLRPMPRTDESTRSFAAATAVSITGGGEGRAVAQPVAVGPATVSEPPNPRRSEGVPSTHSQLSFEPKQTPRSATPMQTDRTTAAGPSPAQAAEAARKTVTAAATTANRLAPHATEGLPLATGEHPIEETITFRVRPILSDMPAARSRQEQAPPAGDVTARSAAAEHDGQRARRPGLSPDADRSADAHRSREPGGAAFDHLLPKVEIALMTTGAREVANTIGQLNEWETLFYMLSGSLGETSETPAPQEASLAPERQEETGGARPPAGHGVEEDLLSVTDEDRTAQAAAPQPSAEDAPPVPLLPRGLEVAIARETIGYPFVPYLPVADTGSVEVEEDEPRRQRRENEAGFSGGEEDGSGGRESGASSMQDETPGAEPSEDKEDGERHDAYDLYQRLSDLP
ncbi:hypothetical protein LRX75_13280 [Rhizobium sp. DKSPLA3]|uniref:Uncharacterized protein n=1 Tax=Rhizobium quercicola TaxID=2901226 RepID=A0A9X1NS23_9HYPH|nr:hypothetical protein [Rhizobium quercicola]MCD7110010.1 hypothetical protein [Rhizobium quercicola]